MMSAVEDQARQVKRKIAGKAKGKRQQEKRGYAEGKETRKEVQRARMAVA
jgi:hypothetical protein